MYALMVALRRGIFHDDGRSATTLTSTMRVATLAGTVVPRPNARELLVGFGPTDQPTRSMVFLACRPRHSTTFLDDRKLHSRRAKHGQVFTIDLGGFRGIHTLPFPTSWSIWTASCTVGEPSKVKYSQSTLEASGNTASAFPDVVVELALPSDAPCATSRRKGMVSSAPS
jgi:hypothetical protein